MMKTKLNRFFRLSSFENEEIVKAANTVAASINESKGSNESEQIPKSPCHAIISMLNVTIESALLIDASGIVRYANNRALSLFGWHQDDTVNGMQSSAFFDFVKGGTKEKWDTSTKKGEFLTSERDAVGYKKNGTKFTVRVQLVELNRCGQIFENGDQSNGTIFCAYIRPDDKIAELNEEILRLTRTEAAMREASSESTVIINERGIISSVDEKTLQLFGYKKDEIIGQNVNMFMHDGPAPGYYPRIINYLKTGGKHIITKRRQLIAKTKKGKIFPIEQGIAEIETNPGETRMFVAKIRNTSDTKGILDASFDPIFNITENGEILMVNQAAEKQFGWSPEEFIGQNISMICGGGHANKHNDYLKRYMKTGKKRVMGKKRELIAKRKDGSEFFIELGLAEIATHEGGQRRFCGFVRDITQLKEHHDKILATQTKFYSGILESSYDSLFVINEHGIIQMVNEAALKNFGWSREEFIGQNVKMIVGGGHGANHDEYLKQYLKTGVKKVMGTQRDLEALRKDGSTFPIRLGLKEIEGHDGTRMFAAFIKDISDTKKVVEMEIKNAAAEFLLLNVLPEDIAFRLIDDPSHIADHHSDATILFADIVGFTTLSSKMEPNEVVSMLNELFSMFDELVEQYDLNKVKTIGDCYMVTSVPNVQAREDDCCRVCNFALDMIAALHKYNESHCDHNLNLRVGINTGPVTAGVVGTKRFLYDLWGDAVNLASRMESTGVPGKIQVPKNVVDATSDNFRYVSRGLTEIKGKGEMETFLLVEQKKAPTTAPDRRLLRKQSRISRRNLKVGSRHNIYESLHEMKTWVSDSNLQHTLATLADRMEDDDDSSSSSVESC